MPRVNEVCRHVRSKNAGPYWITVDFFFKDRASFDAYSDNAVFGASSIAALMKADASLIKRVSLPDLLVVKVSYPRQSPQGGVLERDMHGGQQYVRLLQLEV